MQALKCRQSLLAFRERPAQLKFLAESAHTKSCSQKTLQMLKQLNVISSPGTLAAYERQNLAALSSRWFARSSPEVVQLCTDVAYWIATFDDRVEGHPILGRFTHTPNSLNQ